MKKLYTLFIFSIITFSAFSQVYKPMLSNSSEWYYSYLGIGFSGTFQYSKGSDTIISGTNYTIIQEFYNSFPMVVNNFYREDSLNKKVYTINHANDPEFLLYDFNLLPGDTFFRNVASFPQQGLILDSITNNFNSLSLNQQCLFDSASCFSSPRIFYFSRLNGNSIYDIWIEGVGSLNNLQPYHGMGVTNCETSLTCHFNETGNKDLYFSNWFKRTDGECRALITGIDTYSKNSSSITISPNPNNGENILISGKDLSSVKIYNIHGQLIKTAHVQNDKIELNLIKQTKGIYFVKVQFNNGEIATKKLVLN
ncbi:MAG: T9SS type A sorting domain-containing protein [Flavobacteriales bacterium]|nr:T9SS type A sorting domain-containing protein [Flavobacteriales bacterium]